MLGERGGEIIAKTLNLYGKKQCIEHNITLLIPSHFSWCTVSHQCITCKLCHLVYFTDIIQDKNNRKLMTLKVLKFEGNMSTM